MTNSAALSEDAAVASLYIFVGSERPDVYLNSIAHCLGDNPRLQVVLLHILEDKGRRAESTHRLNEVQSRIQGLIESLIGGEYVHWTRTGREKRCIALEKFHVARYLHVQSVDIKRETVLVEDLDSFVLKAAHPKAIFDVSAAPKAHLARLAAILSSVRSAGLFLFEILRQIEDRPFDERELIHNLTINRDYRFHNLLSEKIVVQPTEVVRQTYVEDISRCVLLVCSLILAIPTSLFILAAFALKWENVEWLSFVVFGLPIGLLIQFIFATFGRELKIDPLSIQRVAARWAQQRFEKKTAHSPRK